MEVAFDIDEYSTILIFIIIASFISFVFSVLPMFLGRTNPDKEKLSSYECGFSEISSLRNVFDVRFYLVAILFIIFDLEIAFLFPWSVSLSNTGHFGFWSMIVFLAILLIGFIYEWYKGALEWE